MATIDLRTETIGAIPSDAIRAHAAIVIPVDATKVSGGLVNGNTYYLGEIPAGFTLKGTALRVKTASALTGTMTLQDGTITPLAAQIMNVAGMFYGTTSLPKYYKVATILYGVIATADIADAIFDVVLDGIQLLPE